MGIALLASFVLAPRWAFADDGGVAANAQGWWDVLTSAPQTPLGANVPSLSAPTADVPQGVLPVTMRLGQPARVAAIGITMTAQPGATVNKLVMTLKASEASGAQQGTGSVKACPIVSFLVPEEKGKAADAPEADCSLAEAVGEKGDDGIWTFDLTSIAQVWLDPFQGVPIQGVRLDPVGGAPATFQVGFTGYQDATFDADIVSGPGGDDAFSSGDLGGGSLGGSLSGGDFSAPTATLPPLPRGQANQGESTAAPRQPVASVAASRAGDTLGNLPLSIVPAMLGTILVAVLASLSLGAGARGREAAARRQGGVSRVLSHRLTDRRGPRG